MEKKRAFISHRFEVETRSLGLNPRVTEKGNLYDKLIAVGSFHLDPLPNVGMDGAKFVIKSPTGERKRVHTLDAAYATIEAWMMEQAATIPTLKAEDSALVTWRIKNYAVA